MDGRFNKPFYNNQEDSENTSDNSGELPFSCMYSEGKMASTSSIKRSRRAVQKRVVSVPIGDVDGSRNKGDGAPPYDSWAWRKYGQKPIKGSPYPRGYYRCSSSKGCPARKQVERSRMDPTMLVITYACDHNHSGPPPSRNSSSSTSTTTTTTTTTTASTTPKSEPEDSSIFTTRSESEDKFTDLADDSLITSTTDDFTWFSDVASTSETLFESPIYTRGISSRDADVAAVIFPMGEEDESLFADLGELPECAVVFQRTGFFLDQERRRRFSLRAG
ncbi:hypothetical protein IFM89_004718 [Coptis chinensis]|uniref:WRKY domain-containing protein n=1 Tax=Coptis chinensis TaxID=261450 RepID=A0A835LHP4_9MAGN|nr:hypothetical protein IFM89_004718 [Coptis chinensis]